MLKPRENKLIYTFFSWYISKIIRLDFRNLTFNDVEIQSDKAILLLANHFSWWDGFLMFQLNKLYFKKNFHVMIDEDNYQKFFFLKYLGAFSVKKGSKSIIETLTYAGNLLDDPRNLVLLFPQGKLYSAFIDTVLFEKGVIHLINSSKRNFQYIFSVSFINYLNKRKPKVTCYLKKWDAEEFTSLQLIKNAFNKHFQLSKNKENNITV